MLLPLPLMLLHHVRARACGYTELTHVGINYDISGPLMLLLLFLLLVVCDKINYIFHQKEL